MGAVGPRGDGYLAGDLDADRYAEYHRPQLAAFAEAGADLATAYTLTTVAEAVGIVRAAQGVRPPGGDLLHRRDRRRLPDGTSLGDAIEQLDAATEAGASHVLVNCAHPDHVSPGLSAAAPWTERIVGIEVNSSRLTHAELDEAEELDEGDLPDLTRRTRELAESLPAVRIVGGCCGTDVRHIAAFWDGWSPVVDTVIK